MPNETPWVDKVKAIPTSLRTLVLIPFTYVLTSVIPDLAQQYVDAAGENIPEAIKAQAYTQVSVYLILGLSIVTAAWILGESRRGVTNPKKRNEIVDENHS